MPASSDRNLLFGLLALKMGFVTRDGLLDAMAAWLDRQGDALGLVLEQRGALAGEQRREIDALLAGHDTGAAGTSLSAARTVGPDEGEPVAGPGAARSRFRALGLHDTGGLGEVYRARDEELGREVALKRIKPEHADYAQIRARFVREAEITGNLEHPGIVPVYGLGTDADGRPYYAMRFIRGEALREAITRYHAGPTERGLRGLLTRFVVVCNAVAYAHSRGVVHRDLKPDNVMLGEYGETLVVDCGLAKIMRSSEAEAPPERPLPLTAGGVAPTAMGQIAGTPEFMPPEQALGRVDVIGPAADVWALGATLYAILTGRPPYAREGALERAAAAEVTPARRVNPRVPAALEAVCARAMQRWPDERYGSATELAAEVERFLADEPVAAMREPWRDWARRWARRHRTAVSGAVALLLASVVGLTVGLGVVRAEQEQTRQQRDRAEGAEAELTVSLAQAEANLKLAEKAVDECYGIAESHSLLNGPALSREQHQLKRLLLQKALPFYRDFQARRPGDGEATRAVWRQNTRLAIIHSELGDKRESLRYDREAERLIRHLVKARPDDLALRADLAGTLSGLGGTCDHLGQVGPALAAYGEARAIYRELTRLRPEDARYRSREAALLNNLAVVYGARGRDEDALRLVTGSIEIRRALVSSAPADVTQRMGLAAALGNRGNVLSTLGKDYAGIASFAEAIALSRKLAAEHRDIPNYRMLLSGNLARLSTLQHNVGQHHEALASTREAVEVARPLMALRPEMRDFRSNLAMALANLGRAQREVGQRPEALATLTESVELGRALYQAEPELEENVMYLVRPLVRRALLRDLPDAKIDLDEALGLLYGLRNVRPNHPDYINHCFEAHRDRARVLGGLGRHREALPDWDQIVALAAPQSRLAARVGRADCLARAGEDDRADAEVAELARQADGQGWALFALARALALSARDTARDARLPLPRRESLAEARARATVALLARAARADAFKRPNNLQTLDGHPDFYTLRRRADFKRFRATLPER